MRWWPLLTVVSVGVLAVLALAAQGYAYYRAADIPPADELRPAEPTVIYDAYGDRVATFDPAAVRRNVDLADVPDHVIHAVLAAEDRGFREHPGFSVKRIAGALIDNLRSDDRVEGGSTITQQYVELAVRDVPRTYLGKLREVATAYKLEHQYTKDEILRFYLDTVHFGRGTQGIAAAARTYFRVAPSELTVEQAALLAGMISGPTRFDPLENPEGAALRRDYVLDGMVEQGWLEPERAQRLIGSSLPEVHPEPPIHRGPNAYYLAAVRRQLRDELPDHRDPRLGLEIHTGLDPRLQELALSTLRGHLEELPYTGSVVSIDPRSGAVRVVVGGLDFQREQFNAATRARRQPGSSFKPFTLATFVDHGWSPQSSYDAPAEYTVEREGTEDYTAHNYSGHGWGDVSVRFATTHSINTVFVQMQQDVGTGEVIEMAHRLGIGRELPEIPSLTLGSVGVAPIDMASAYATLAANGEHHDPYLVAEVLDARTGEVVVQHREMAEDPIAEGSATPAAAPGASDVGAGVDPNVAAVVTDVLADNVDHGTGTAAQLPDRVAAGKTGTTDDFRDAWFVGYVPQLTTAVWIGNRDNTPMDGVTGGSIPAATWGDYMAQALEGAEVLEFPEPDLEPLERYDPDELDDETTSPSPATASPTAAPTATSSPSPTATTTTGPTATASPTDGGSPSPDDGILPTEPQSRTNRSGLSPW